MKAKRTMKGDAVRIIPCLLLMRDETSSVFLDKVRIMALVVGGCVKKKKRKRGYFR